MVHDLSLTKHNLLACDYCLWFLKPLLAGYSFPAVKYVKDGKLISVYIKKNAPFSLLVFFFQIFSKTFLDLTVSSDDVRTIPSPSSSLALASLTPAKDISAFPLSYTVRSILG